MADRVSLVAELGAMVKASTDPSAVATLRAAIETIMRDTALVERAERRKADDRRRKRPSSVDSADSADSTDSTDSVESPSLPSPSLSSPEPLLNPSAPLPPPQQQLRRAREEPAADEERIAASKRELATLLAAGNDADREGAARVVGDFIAEASPASRYAWVRSLIAVLQPLGAKAMPPAVLFRAMHDFLVADRVTWPFSGRVFRRFVDVTAEAMAREATGNVPGAAPRARASPGGPSSTSAALREWAARVDGRPAPPVPPAAPDPSTLTRSA